jgi:hypothetical protein
MTPKTAPYRILVPLLGFPVGSILIGYPWKTKGVEILGNGNRQFVEPGAVERYYPEVVKVQDADDDKKFIASGPTR